jgi:DNA-binding transcriptional LysR family regulator
VEIRQLEHFVTAAEEGHFSRAAERSNIVQSGLSASIRALEGELGTRLFDRTTRRVALTESGLALLPEARRVLAAATAAREAVAGVEGLTRGTLSIGIMQSLVAVRLPALLARFRALHPGVDIRLRQAGTTTLLQEVRDGRLELAFASLPDPAPAGLVGHELLSEVMMLVCSPEHPLAGRARLSLADLRDEPFVDGHPAWGIRTSNDRASSTSAARSPAST